MPPAWLIDNVAQSNIQIFLILQYQQKILFSRSPDALGLYKRCRFRKFAQMSQNSENPPIFAEIQLSICTLTQKNFRNACYQVGFCTGFISTGVIQILEMIRCIAYAIANDRKKSNFL